MKKKIFIALMLLSAPTHASEPIATGSVKTIAHDGGFFYILTVKASKDVNPGISFYPLILFVLDDNSRIEGSTGYFPTGLQAGQELGGDVTISYNVQVPEGRRVKAIEMIAAVSNPNTLFPGAEGQSFKPLDEKTINDLKDVGGLLLQFPVCDNNDNEKQNKSEQATPRKPSD